MRLKRLTLTRVHGLLALVLLMAVASGFAFWSTLRQAQSLAQPHQQGDLWYMASVNNELARVLTSAQQTEIVTTADDMARVEPDELALRLDVLASVLDSTQQLPQVRQRLTERVPMAGEALTHLAQAVDGWLAPLVPQRRPEALQQVAQAIRRQAPALQEQVRLALAAVHVAASNDHAADREQLQQRFTWLSLVLGGLMLGTAGLTWQLVHEIRSARATSHHLTDTNRRLEARVMARTRQIEEGRLLLNFILDASPSEVLLIHAQTHAVIFMNQRLLTRLKLQRPPSHLPLPQLLSDPGQAQALAEALEKNGEVQAMEALIGPSPPAWVSISARLIDVDGELAYLLWSFDIGAHKRLEAHLRDLATTDPHSGLVHRHVYLDKGAALLEQCIRQQQNCAVLAIGIDNLNALSRAHKLTSTDPMVALLATMLRSTLRESDAVGRLGDTTFGVVLPRADEQAALEASARLFAATATLTAEHSDAPEQRVSLSIGYSTRRARQIDLETLRHEAEQALTRAQNLGGGQIVAFSSPSAKHHAVTDC